MTTLYTHIEQLINTRLDHSLLRGEQLMNLPIIENAFLLVEDEQIASYGHMSELELMVPHLPEVIINKSGASVLPAWCDSHTHLVYAGSREHEFVDKLKGLSYAEIAAKGGGILNSAHKLQQASEDELFLQAWARLQEISKLGTGAVEIKSGYGLTVEAELKMLRVIKKLRSKSSLAIKSTFLGAHTFPVAFREDHEGYIRQIIEEMLPVIAAEQLADYIDVFCETGFYNPEEMKRIIDAGKSYGLKPRLHVNQLNSIGGLQQAIKLEAISADHLETMTSKDIHDLAASATIGTLLPSAAFFLRMPYQPARELIDAGAAIALASDYNPGSSPTGNMNLIVSLACIQMKMLPEEAINAATLNGAYAMELERDLGSVTAGKKANLIFTRPIPSFAYLPYAFGSNLISGVMINGRFIY
jgi:imidazolonepropionase